MMGRGQARREGEEGLLPAAAPRSTNTHLTVSDIGPRGRPGRELDALRGAGRTRPEADGPPVHWLDLCLCYLHRRQATENSTGHGCAGEGGPG